MHNLPDRVRFPAPQHMKFFKYLSFWERLFYVLSVVVFVLDIYLMISTGFKFGKGFLGIIPLYGFVYITSTLNYCGLDHIPDEKKTFQDRNQISKFNDIKGFFLGRYDIKICYLFGIGVIIYHLFFLFPFFLGF